MLHTCVSLMCFISTSRFPHDVTGGNISFEDVNIFGQNYVTCIHTYIKTFSNGPRYACTLRSFLVMIDRTAIATVQVSSEWGFMHCSLMYCC